jgi:hypothetical protein
MSTFSQFQTVDSSTPDEHGHLTLKKSEFHPATPNPLS